MKEGKVKDIRDRLFAGTRLAKPLLYSALFLTMLLVNVALALAQAQYHPLSQVYPMDKSIDLGTYQLNASRVNMTYGYARGNVTIDQQLSVYGGSLVAYGVNLPLSVGDGSNLVGAYFNASSFGLLAEVDDASAAAVEGGALFGRAMNSTGQEFVDAGLARYDNNDGWMGLKTKYRNVSANDIEARLASLGSAVYGDSGSNPGTYAGYFKGNTTVTDSLSVGGGSLGAGGLNPALSVGDGNRAIGTFTNASVYGSVVNLTYTDQAAAALWAERSDGNVGGGFALNLTSYGLGWVGTWSMYSSGGNSNLVGLGLGNTALLAIAGIPGSYAASFEGNVSIDDNLTVGNYLCLNSDCRNVWPGGGGTNWNVAASGTAGSAAVTDGETVNFTAGTGITVTRDQQNITVSSSGLVAGSGASGRIAVWNGTSSVNSSPNIVWDFANSRLGIGTTSPVSTLAVGGPGFPLTGIYGEGTLFGVMGNGSSMGVIGYDSDDSDVWGVLGHSTFHAGVYGFGYPGVYGSNVNVSGHRGELGGALFGAHGRLDTNSDTSGYLAYNNSNRFYGAYGKSVTAGTANIGVYGEANSGSLNIGVVGNASGSGSSVGGSGVFGTGSSYGVYGSSAGNAGYFQGNVTVTGNVTVGTGTVFIDGTNSRVGIGTTSPTQTLEVSGNTNITGYVYIAGGPAKFSGVDLFLSVGDGTNLVGGMINASTFGWYGIVDSTQNGWAIRGATTDNSAAGTLANYDADAGWRGVSGEHTSSRMGFLANGSYGAYGVYDDSDITDNYGYLGGSGRGVHGQGSTYGVYGVYDDDHYGYLGASFTGAYGYSNTGTGTGVTGYHGGSDYGYLGYGTAQTGYGVYGQGRNFSGYFWNTDTTGDNYGVYGRSSGTTAPGWNYGGYFTASGGGSGNVGVVGNVSGPGTPPVNVGVFGTAGVYGVYGYATYAVYGYSQAFNGHGVHGTSAGAQGTGVYGSSSFVAINGTGGAIGVYGYGTSNAGYFDGNVTVTGNLTTNSFFKMGNISSPGSCTGTQEGYTYYNNTRHVMCFCNSTHWRQADNSSTC